MKLNALEIARLNDLRLQIECYMASINRRAEAAEESGSNRVVLTESEAWSVLNVMSFVECLQRRLPMPDNAALSRPASADDQTNQEPSTGSA